jgi:hypothetical protein
MSHRCQSASNKVPADRRCLGCAQAAQAGRDFCSDSCEHEYTKRIESATDREEVETGDKSERSAWNFGGTHRRNFQNQA